MSNIIPFPRQLGAARGGAAAKSATNQMQTATAKVGDTYGPDNIVDLREGHCGKIVAEMQCLLVAANLMKQSSGQFDQATVYAVRQFQVQVGLPSTGKIDYNTRKMLLEFYLANRKRVADVRKKEDTRVVAVASTEIDHQMEMKEFEAKLASMTADELQEGYKAAKNWQAGLFLKELHKRGILADNEKKEAQKKIAKASDEELRSMWKALQAHEGYGEERADEIMLVGAIISAEYEKRGLGKPPAAEDVKKEEPKAEPQSTPPAEDTQTPPAQDQASPPEPTTETPPVSDSTPPTQLVPSDSGGGGGGGGSDTSTSEPAGDVSPTTQLLTGDVTADGDSITEALPPPKKETDTVSVVGGVIVVGLVAAVVYALLKSRPAVAPALQGYNGALSVEDIFGQDDDEE